MEITSRNNERVKRAAQLRERSARDEQGRIIIDGAREIFRAIDGGVTIVEAFVCHALLHGQEARDLATRLSESTATVHEVTPSVLEKLAFGQRAEGVLAIATTPSVALADLKLSASLSAPPLVAVLEGVEKPGNVGAVIRSADAAGVSAVIVADPVTDLYNPNAIRASLGTIFTTPACAAASADVVNWMLAQGLAIYAARVDAELSYLEADFRKPSAIVLGSEAHGLSSTWNAERVIPIRLPMQGVADSLNVSATAAILFYEALRQRDFAE